MAISLLLQPAPHIPCSAEHQFGVMRIEAAKGRDRGHKRVLLARDSSWEGCWAGCTVTLHHNIYREEEEAPELEQLSLWEQQQCPLRKGMSNL